MSTVYLKGGAVIENVLLSWDKVEKSRDAREVIAVPWKPGFTPHRPDSFKVYIDPAEIVALQVSGR